jgi:hypothetical protein
MDLAIIRLFNLGRTDIEIARILELKYFYVISVISEFLREPYIIIESKINYLE